MSEHMKSSIFGTKQPVRKSVRLKLDFSAKYKNEWSCHHAKGHDCDEQLTVSESLLIFRSFCVCWSFGSHVFADLVTRRSPALIQPARLLFGLLTGRGRTAAPPLA